MLLLAMDCNKIGKKLFEQDNQFLPEIRCKANDIYKKLGGRYPYLVSEQMLNSGKNTW